MIKSMTAFAREAGEGDWGRATWELRSVNHRYLDVTIKMPENLRVLENKVRELVKHYCSRGKVECFLRFQPGVAVDSAMLFNEKLMIQLGEACHRMAGHLPHAGSIDPARLLSWPGVLQTTEVDMTSIHEHVLSVLKNAFEQLSVVRSGEGNQLREILLCRIEGMHEQVSLIKKRLPAVLTEQREKIVARFAELSIDLDKQRLEQEMVMLMQKMDVAEELDRLATHLNEVARVLRKDKVVGRRLDFLMQELNRETNTLGAKSSDILVTKAMVEMKVLTEQMREQVQNLE